MANVQKLLRQIRGSPHNTRFADLCRAAEACGYVLDHIRGSHHVYFHAVHRQSSLNLQPGSSGKAKPYQIRQFLEEVDRYNLGNE